MTQEQKIIRAKMGFVEQAKRLNNVSQACWLCSKHRTAPEIEQAVVEMALLTLTRAEIAARRKAVR